MRIATLALSATAALALVATPAHASTYDDYIADGGIQPCTYDPSQLQGDLSDAPSDIRQYDPGYLEALRRALDAQASGQCDPQAAPAAQSVPSQGGGAPKRRGEAAAGPVIPVASSAISLGDIRDGDGVPGWATALGAFGLLLAAAATALTLMFARNGLRSSGGDSGSSSAISDYWWALRDRIGR